MGRGNSAVVAAAVATVAAASFMLQIEPLSEPSAVIHEDMLVVIIPTKPAPVASSSGKTLLVASTGGFKEITEVEVDGKPIRVNITGYIYPGENGAYTAAQVNSGVVKATITKGTKQAILTKECLLVAVPAVKAYMSSGGKMMLITKTDGNIKTGIMFGEEELIVNITAGYYPQPKVKA